MAPAAVTLELVEQVRRQLFVAARQVVGNPHAPAGPTHQRRFNEVVGEDRTGERTFSGQRRQSAVLNERLHPDDRVMTPVVRFAQLPEVQASGEQRAVDAGSKLLHACIQGVHARSLRCSLDDPGVRVGFHQTDQAGQAFATHHAVGVEHHHIAVITAPTTAEVVEVAAFALHSAATAPVEDTPEALGLAAHFQPGLLLGHGNISVVGVTEYKEVEAVQITGGSHRLEGRPQAGKHARHIFVTDRHDDGGTRTSLDRLVASTAAGNAVLVAAGQQLEEAHQGGPETRRHPAEEDTEQNQDAGLQGIRPDLASSLQQRLVGDFVKVDERPALVRQNTFHVPAGNDGLPQHQCQQNVAAHGADPAPARLGQVTLGRSRSVSAAGQAAPGANQDVGAPRLRNHPSTPDRRRGLQAHPAAAIHRQHLGIVQGLGTVQVQALANRSLHSFGITRARLGRQTLMQLAERGAAGKFCPLLIAQW
ncbi:hypothetical protein D3C80_741630 [compost metagenome]